MANVISFNMAETVSQPRKADKCSCCISGRNGICKIFNSHLKPWLGRFQNILSLPNCLLRKELLLRIIRTNFIKE